MRKNLIAGAASIFLLISLTACGAGNTADVKAAASQTMETQETGMMEGPDTMSGNEYGKTGPRLRDDGFKWQYG